MLSFWRICILVLTLLSLFLGVLTILVFLTLNSNFYFGCEADDRMAATAFNPRLNHFDARLKAMFGSDVGHFDVPDMTQVLAEAFDLVEHELISQDDFRDFTFTNVVELHASMNPNFFKGTVVEHDVAKLMTSR